MTEQEAAYRCLREYKTTLTRHQTKTLAGQIKAGNVTAAMKGLNTIMERSCCNGETPKRNRPEVF